MACSPALTGRSGWDCAGFDGLGAAVARRPAEHDEIDERVRAEPVRAMDARAGRLAKRHQAGHGRVEIAGPGAQRLAHIVRWNAAHVVVDRGQDRDRLAAKVDARENLRALGDAGQALGQDFRVQMVEVKVDVVLLRADAAAFADLDGDRARNHVAAGKVLRVRRVALHETLARRVGEITALAARALGDEHARAVNAGGMELHELHILERQARAQHKRIAVARAGVRSGAGEKHAAVAAGRDNRLLGAEAVNAAVFEAQGHDAAAHALVHDEIEREILDEELGRMAQRLADKACAAWRARCGPPPRRCAGQAGLRRNRWSCRRTGADRSCRPRCG